MTGSNNNLIPDPRTLNLGLGLGWVCCVAGFFLIIINSGGLEVMEIMIKAWNLGSCKFLSIRVFFDSEELSCLQHKCGHA